MTENAEPLEPIPLLPEQGAPFFYESSRQIDLLMGALVGVCADVAMTDTSGLNSAFNKPYATISDNIAALKKPCATHGIFYNFCLTTTQETVSCQILIGHKSSQWLVTKPITLPVLKRDLHGFKSASTYLKRIALEAAFSLGSDDDDGNLAANVAPKGESNIEKRIDEIGRCITSSMLDSYVKSLPVEFKTDERIVTAYQARHHELGAKA